MTPAAFSTIGAALFGPSWQTPLAEALGVNVKTVYRYGTGKSATIPQAVLLRLKTLLYERQTELLKLANTINA